MTKPADPKPPAKQPDPPKPEGEELDEDQLGRVSGGTTFPAGDGGAKDSAFTVKL